jgi:hypothetical protein
MRTTLDLDADLILVAKELAAQQRVTIGKVVSQLLRKALEPGEPAVVRNGIPLFTPVPGAAKPTLSVIERLRDEE